MVPKVNHFWYHYVGLSGSMKAEVIFVQNPGRLLDDFAIKYSQNMSFVSSHSDLLYPVLVTIMVYVILCVITHCMITKFHWSHNKHPIWKVHKINPIAHPHARGMDSPLRVHGLIYFLPLSLSWHPIASLWGWGMECQSWIHFHRKLYLLHWSISC